VEMTRRGFLKTLAASALVIAAPSMATIWVPEQPELALPLEPVIQASLNGDLVYGWILPRDMGDLSTLQDDLHMIQETLFEDAFRYFPPNAPIMLLAGEPIARARRNELQRFVWRGNGSPIMTGGTTMRAVATWPHLGYMAKSPYNIPTGGRM
jgi:hypothetical protein